MNLRWNEEKLKCDGTYGGWLHWNTQWVVIMTYGAIKITQNSIKLMQKYGKCLIENAKSLALLSVCCDFAIEQHLVGNEVCTKRYNEALFSVLATARSLFHFSVLEATYINSLQPILCHQKEFIYSLEILHLLYFWRTFRTKTKQ